MKKLLVIVFLLVSFVSNAQFENYFSDTTLRLDYFHTGNDTIEIYSFDELIIEGEWSGSKTNLIDPFGYGKYAYKIFSLEDEKLIYSNGYSSLFGEWQTTDEAKETWRTFSETIIFPFPKDKVRVEFYSRSWEGNFEKKFEYIVDPSNYFIKKDNRLVFPSYDVHVSGPSDKKVDIAIIPEGYTPEEMEKLIKDCEVFKDGLFSVAPFKNHKDKFNIRVVLAPSGESGSDIPATGIWKNTILNTNYYTFDSERYLMSADNKSIRDLAANVPYDQIYILVNSDKYGGGSIYNHYNLSVINNGFSAKIIVHEFGHGFAGLADEYFDSSTSYNDFYNLAIEPWEPNITTLVDFGSKWESMVKKKTPVPTPPEEIYKDKVGAFEGGGYVAKGVYRPEMDCLMNTFRTDTFCPVCSEAIEEMIKYMTE